MARALPNNRLQYTSDSEAQKIDLWLEHLGLRYDPFRVLNAGEDTQLQEYLVGHERFEAIRGDNLAFVFAPAGGGKSAFRVRLARACRVGENNRRLFPVVYTVPKAVLFADETERLPKHLLAIWQMAAFELLLRLAYRPNEFYQLDSATRQLVRSFLEWKLPSPLLHLLNKLETPGDLLHLAHAYDPTARWPESPDSRRLHHFRQALAETPALSQADKPADEFATWLDLLTGPLGFEAVYLLLDGVDAYPETQQDIEKQLALIASLLEQAPAWAGQRFFLKAFLPAELEPLLRRSFPGLTAAATVSVIEWTPKLLIGLLNSRVQAATETAPATLDMLCYPGLRQASSQVVQMVQPLPREVLAFVERIFHEHLQRAGPTGKLTREDVEAAQHHFKNRLLASPS